MYIPWMCWIFCPRIRREMATLDEEPEDDPLDWELEKIEKLKRRRGCKEVAPAGQGA